MFCRRSWNSFRGEKFGAGKPLQALHSGQEIPCCHAGVSHSQNEWPYRLWKNAFLGVGVGWKVGEKVRKKKGLHFTGLISLHGVYVCVPFCRAVL